MTRKKRVLKDIGFYSTSILLTQVVTVAASVATRRFLGPAQMGVWAFLQTLLSYAEYSALGTVTAASMEIPLHNGRGESDQAKRVADAAFSFALITSLTVAAGAILYAVARRRAMSEELFYGFLMGAAFVVLQRFNGLVITLVRANKDFVLAGKQMLYSSLVNAGLIALLSYRYKIYGFLTAMALSLLFNIVYLVRRADLKLKFVPDWKRMAGLVHFGFPLMIAGFMGTVFETMDRLFITRFLGFEALGLYSIALMTINYLNGIPNSVGVVTISHLQEAVGGAEGSAAVKKYLKKADAGYGLLMAALIGSAWFLMPWMVRIVLPKFNDGIPALRLLVLGTFFSALAQGYLQLVYVLRKHRALLVLMPIAILISAGLNLLAIRAGLGLRGIAGATALGSFAYFNLLFFYGSLQAETVRKSSVRYLGLIAWFAFFASLLLGIEKWGAFGGEFFGPWLRTAAFLACLTPAFWRNRNEFGFLDRWPFRKAQAS